MYLEFINHVRKQILGPDSSVCSGPSTRTLYSAGELLGPHEHQSPHLLLSGSH